MSDERELKLECLRLSDGNLGHAQDLFAWVAADGEPTNLEFKLYELWGILDDIDTADDLAKDNEALYRNLVRKHAQRRFEVLPGEEWDVLRARICDTDEDDGLTRNHEPPPALSPASPVGLDSFSQGAGETSEPVLPETVERAEQGESGGVYIARDGRCYNMDGTPHTPPAHDSGASPPEASGKTEGEDERDVVRIDQQKALEQAQSAIQESELEEVE